MFGLGILPGRPRRGRGTIFTAGIIVIAATAMLSAPVRADAATQPSIGVEWFPTPNAATQCGSPTVTSQWAASPGWTSPIRIDTDSRPGGCQLAFGIFDPSGLLTGGAAYQWSVSPQGDSGQCGDPGFHPMPLNSNFELFGSLVTDDTDNRPGWCNLQFLVNGNSNIGLDVQFFADPGNSDNQCVGALPQGTFYTVVANSAVTVGLNTDDRPGGCWLALRLRFFSSAAAAQHAAGIHRL